MIADKQPKANNFSFRFVSSTISNKVICSVVEKKIRVWKKSQEFFFHYLIRI